MVVTGAVALAWGASAVAGAATLGGIATGVQLLAARMLERSGVSPSLDHLKVYALGVGFRLLGIAMLGLLVSLDRKMFPLLPSALGYLGTVLPLLYLETRLSP